MEEDLNEKTGSNSIDETHPLIIKLRKVFPDKSKKFLTKAFLQLISGVYKKSSDSANIVNNYKSLNLIEFKIAVMKNYKDKFVLGEIKPIFSFLDDNKNGRIELEEFIVGIRGVLNDSRQQIVNFLFYRLDRNSSGYIENSELRSFFSKSLLPEIISQQTDPAKKSSEFTSKYGSNDKISLEQFTDYYVSKSIKTNSDAKFKTDCLDEWLFRNEDADSFFANQLQPAGRSPLRRKGSVVPSSSVDTIASDVTKVVKKKGYSILDQSSSKTQNASNNLELQKRSSASSDDSFASVDVMFNKAPNTIQEMLSFQDDDDDDESNIDKVARSHRDGDNRRKLEKQRLLDEEQARIIYDEQAKLIYETNQSRIATRPANEKSSYKNSPRQNNQEPSSSVGSTASTISQADQVQQNLDPNSGIDIDNMKITVNSLKETLTQQIQIIEFQGSKIDEQCLMIRNMQAALGFK